MDYRSSHREVYRPHLSLSAGTRILRNSSPRNYIDPVRRCRGASLRRRRQVLHPSRAPDCWVHTLSKDSSATFASISSTSAAPTTSPISDKTCASTSMIFAYTATTTLDSEGFDAQRARTRDAVPFNSDARPTRPRTRFGVIVWSVGGCSFSLEEPFAKGGARLRRL